MLDTDTWWMGVPHLICCTSVLESQISIYFALLPAVFELQAIWDKCTEWPQMTLNTTGSKVPKYVLLVSWVPNFRPLRFLAAVFELQAILRQVQRMTPNDLEYYKVKCTPYMCCYCPWVRNYSPFRYTTSSCRDMRLPNIANPHNDLGMTLNI